MARDSRAYHEGNVPRWKEREAVWPLPETIHPYAHFPARWVVRTSTYMGHSISAKMQKQKENTHLRSREFRYHG